jgi:hypothetical protein
MSEAISFSSSWVCGKKRCLTSMSAAIVVAVLFGAERPKVFAHATPMLVQMRGGVRDG